MIVINYGAVRSYAHETINGHGISRTNLGNGYAVFQRNHDAFERRITALFGSQNARQIKKLDSRIDAIGALEPHYQAMTDEELKQQTTKFRSRLKVWRIAG